MGKPLKSFSGRLTKSIIIIVLVIMAWAGNTMKKSRETREKSNSVLQKCGRGDIRIQK